jgi:protease-4
VKAVVLRINSPGGEVTASDTLFHAVKTVAAAKPVVVFMDAMAASGGYYTACGATKIVASETTLTGSIGVIIDALNYSGLFEKVGLKSNTFVSGAFKDSLNGARPMRAEEEAYIQSLVTGMYERFLKVVADGRGIATDVLRNGVADGRVLSGKEALDAGLVDQLGYIEDARRLAAELAGVKDPTLVRYRRETGFFDILGGVSAPFAGRGDSGRTVRLELAPGAYPALTPGLPYYLAPLSVPAR